MASDQSFVDYVCEQANLPKALTYRKMFGEYALYLDEKVIALICDNSLFVKPTDAGRTLLGKVVERPPYPGAKNHFLADEVLDDPELLQRLCKATANALPIAMKKRAAAKKRKVAKRAK